MGNGNLALGDAQYILPGQIEKETVKKRMSNIE